MKRQYYSVRTGKLELNQEMNLELLKKLFLAIYKRFEEKGFFQKYFGYWCVDADYVNGELGQDIDAQIFLHLKKQDLYPISDKIEDYNEEDLFDIIEFLHDYISEPLEGDFHSWNNCGWHYNKFNDELGKSKFREEVNSILKSYQDGFEISNQGEILSLPENGLRSIFVENIPTEDNANIKQRIEKAVLKFRQYRSTWDDRKDAVRELVDVLEYIRNEAKKYLKREDESDLFNIANNFAIRHHNIKQKTDYDLEIWYTWMFYFYLSTIHALLKMIEKGDKI